MLVDQHPQKDFYKIPSLICPVVNNQKLISKFLHEKNFQLNLHKNLFFDYEQWKKAFKF